MPLFSRRQKSEDREASYREQACQALYDACKKNQWRVVQGLLHGNSYADPNFHRYQGRSRGNTPFTVAAALGHISLVRNMYAQFGSRINVNAQTKNGWTALHLAVLHDSVDILRLLVEEVGVDITVRNVDRDRPIDIAAKYGKHTAHEYLVKVHNRAGLMNAPVPAAPAPAAPAPAPTPAPAPEPEPHAELRAVLKDLGLEASLDAFVRHGITVPRMLVHMEESDVKAVLSNAIQRRTLLAHIAELRGAGAPSSPAPAANGADALAPILGRLEELQDGTEAILDRLDNVQEIGEDTQTLVEGVLKMAVQ